MSVETWTGFASICPGKPGSAGRRRLSAKAFLQPWTSFFFHPAMCVSGTGKAGLDQKPLHFVGAVLLSFPQQRRSGSAQGHILLMLLIFCGGSPRAANPGNQDHPATDPRTPTSGHRPSRPSRNCNARSSDVKRTKDHRSLAHLLVAQVRKEPRPRESAHILVEGKA